MSCPLIETHGTVCTITVFDTGTVNKYSLKCNGELGSEGRNSIEVFDFYDGHKQTAALCGGLPLIYVFTVFYFVSGKYWGCRCVVMELGGH
jgi:hypothetical protein